MTTIARVLAPLRPAARVLTGSTYVLLGFDALRAPGARVDQAAPVLAAVRTVVPLPADDELVVRANAAMQVVAGGLLAVGLAPRLSALALAGSLVPTTWAGHAYWTIEDPAARKVQRIQFHKNMAMIGGLLFAALDQPHAHPHQRDIPSVLCKSRVMHINIHRYRGPDLHRPLVQVLLPALASRFCITLPVSNNAGPGVVTGEPRTMRAQ